MAEQMQVLSVSYGNMEGRDYASAWVVPLQWDDRLTGAIQIGPVPMKMPVSNKDILQIIKPGSLPAIFEIEASIRSMKGASGPVPTLTMVGIKAVEPQKAASPVKAAA